MARTIESHIYLVLVLDSLPTKKCKIHEQNTRKLYCMQRDLISIFGTTYTCQSQYTSLKFIKSKHLSVLSEEHLKEIVRTSLTTNQSDFRTLTKALETHKASSST